jgi:hypothetical protein
MLTRPAVIDLRFAALGSSGGDGAPTATTAPTDDAASKACGAVYKHASEFAPYWVAQSDGGVALASLPEERDFRAVCMTLPENIRRCMFEGYRVGHKDSCEAMLSRIDAPTRNKIDSLFLAAASAPPASPAASASAGPLSPPR